MELNYFNLSVCFFLKGVVVVFILVYCNFEIIFFVIVNVVVIFGNGKDEKLSEFIEFIYKFKLIFV